MRRKPITGEESTFNYDSLDRLTSVAGPDGARSYGYDPVGNRLTRVAGPTTSYTYDRADRLTSAGGIAITTDANGNLVARGSDAYSYDQANQLSSATVGGATETYVYDGTGARFSRQVGAGTPTRYVSDIGTALPTVIDDGSRKYVYGMGLAYAVNGSAIEVYHADRLASTRAITNASGTVTAGYRSDEWGIPKASTGSSAQPFGYTGEPGDGTGLTYLRARYYNPDLGRFMSRDTWFGSPVISQSLNRYSYVVNNPITRNDPSGHCGVDSLADVAFMVYDVGALAFGPPKDRLGNLLALGADTIGLIIPCATGLGLAVRGSVKVAEHADEVPKAIKWVDEAVRAFCSFTPETLVATPNGPVAISSIQVGDSVLAWDEVLGSLGTHRVLAVLSHHDNEISRVVIGGASIVTTPNHRFLTDVGWIPAGQLRPGSRLRSANSQFGSVASVQTEEFNGTLWNLSVEGVHTFAVGSGRWVVHNECSHAEDIIAHGWEKHGTEFGFLKGPDDYGRMADNIIHTSDTTRQLGPGRVAYFDHEAEAIVIVNEHGPSTMYWGTEETFLNLPTSP